MRNEPRLLRCQAGLRDWVVLKSNSYDFFAFGLNHKFKYCQKPKKERAQTLICYYVKKKIENY